MRYMIHLMILLFNILVIYPVWRSNTVIRPWHVNGYFCWKKGRRLLRLKHIASSTSFVNRLLHITQTIAHFNCYGESVTMQVLLIRNTKCKYMQDCGFFFFIYTINTTTMPKLLSKTQPREHSESIYVWGSV